MLRLFNRSDRARQSKESPSDRRSLPRAIVNRAVAIVDGANLQLVNWNVKGFLAHQYYGRHMVGTRVSAKLIIPGRSGGISFSSDGVVVRVSKQDGYIAVMFIEMDERTREKVERYVAMNYDRMNWDRPQPPK